MTGGANRAEFEPGEVLARGPAETTWMAYGADGAVWAAAYVDGRIVRGHDGAWHTVGGPDEKLPLPAAAVTALRRSAPSWPPALPRLAGLVDDTSALGAYRSRRDPDGSLVTILDDVAGLLGRYVVFPRAGEDPVALWAVTLWVAHCHVLDAFESTPRLALLSPEKGSGKTRCLEMLELVCPTARHAVNMTAAALFRAVAANRPTLLFDEADTFFGPRASSDHEELRGLLNAGHRRGAVAYRCVGEPAKMEVREFPAFCAVALAGIGDLPDTILDRAVLVRMRRRAPDERVEPFRARKVTPEATKLRARLAGWAETAVDSLADVEPAMPEGLTDRPADVWEPLLAVADAAGGHWPGRARVAAVALNRERQVADPSLGVRLLGDVRACFDAGGVDRFASADLVAKLAELEEAPWGDLRGKPLDARGLAARLRKYDARPHDVRIGERVLKGYDRADFYDAWKRYLSPSGESPQHALRGQPEGESAGGDADEAQHRHSPQQDPPPLTCDVAPVAGVAHFSANATEGRRVVAAGGVDEGNGTASERYGVDRPGELMLWDRLGDEGAS